MTPDLGQKKDIVLGVLARERTEEISLAQSRKGREGGRRKWEQIEMATKRASSTRKYERANKESIQ
jgi:hypothetical protein